MNDHQEELRYKPKTNAYNFIEKVDEINRKVDYCVTCFDLLQKEIQNINISMRHLATTHLSKEGLPILEDELKEL